MKRFNVKKVIVVAVAIMLSHVSNVLALDEDKALKTLITVDAIKNTKEAVVTIRSFEANKSLVRLLDESGNIVYKQPIQLVGVYKKRFDFSELSNGNYVLEILIANKVFKSYVSVQENQIVTISEPHVRYQLFSVQGNDVLFRLDPTESAYVQLFNEEGVLVAAASIEGEGKFSELPKGNYLVHIAFHGKTHVDYLTIE
ncbi:MAG: hypothetical protein NZM38_08335 [Cytophagales bacterium]|nr:hypothetical protein [Cytophagales bacterium]MDW8384765.1 hypothetical protein [Flammeovirgaceae bacterium]